MRTFIENYLHFMKNCIRPHYEKLKPLKSGFIENLNFENNRDPWRRMPMNPKYIAEKYEKSNSQILGVKSEIRNNKKTNGV